MTARHLLRPAAGHDYCDLAPGRRTARERRRLGACAAGASCWGETRNFPGALSLRACQPAWSLPLPGDEAGVAAIAGPAARGQLPQLSPGAENNRAGADFSSRCYGMPSSACGWSRPGAGSRSERLVSALEVERGGTRVGRRSGGLGCGCRRLSAAVSASSAGVSVSLPSARTCPWPSCGNSSGTRSSAAVAPARSRPCPWRSDGSQNTLTGCSRATRGSPEGIPRLTVPPCGLALSPSNRGLPKFSGF